VIYKGPWRQVADDDGHVFVRGERAAVCDKTFRIMTQVDGRYAGILVPVAPHHEVPLDDAAAFDCARTVPRHPRETKGEDCAATLPAASPACGPEGCC